ncbi:MAG: aspartate aminotransferase family protein [Alphaproteobacteria bacterium]|nr:aspartate aminotransferase family protein [Alphaproteobacteria bacterium]
MEKHFHFSNAHKDLIARDAESVLGWRYAPGIIFESGRGSTITDVDGNEYLDFTSGMMCLPLGHSHEELTETLRQQAGRFVHENSWYSNPQIIAFAEALTATLPDGLDVVNFTVTGSKANEVAMRMALGASGKHDIVSVIRGLHGGSLAVEGLTSIGGARRRNLGPLLPPANAPAIHAPLCWRCPINLEYPACGTACLAASEELIDQTTSSEAAAIIAETMLVAGGMIVPPREWLPGLKDLAARHGAFLILDEAQLAPARTGRMWGFEHYGVVPDMVTFAKGMSAGLAICGVVTRRDIAEEARGRAGTPWAGTYSGDPLPAAVALKQLEIVERDDLSARAEKLGARLTAGLKRLCQSYEAIGDVRGQGLYSMIDVVADKKTKRPDAALAERIRYNAALEGLIFICVKNFMRFCPPLIIAEAEIDAALAALERAIKRALAGYPRDVDFRASSSLAAGAERRAGRAQ